MTKNEIQVFKEQNPIELKAVQQPIAGDATLKNLLSMYQLSEEDIFDYLREAEAAEGTMPYGIDLLKRRSLLALMRQPSTRTGGSFEEAMTKLGGAGRYRGGMESSSEAKGESRYDSEVALATQNDIIAERTSEEYGPMFAAYAIEREVRLGHLERIVPVINAGDGRNEHPTQTLGDLFTIYKEFGELKGLTLSIFADYERYRAARSLLIGAAAVGMNVIAVEPTVAPVPADVSALFAPGQLITTGDIDEAMRRANVLWLGRNPDEYDGKDAFEKARSAQLAKEYAERIIDVDRLQKMPTDAIVMHPRPRRDELHPSVDTDRRVRDVAQMQNMIPMRMAIVARHLGVSILDAMKDTLE